MQADARNNQMRVFALHYKEIHKFSHTSVIQLVYLKGKVAAKIISVLKLYQ